MNICLHTPAKKEQLRCPSAHRYILTPNPCNKIGTHRFPNAESFCHSTHSYRQTHHSHLTRDETHRPRPKQLTTSNHFCAACYKALTAKVSAVGADIT